MCYPRPWRHRDEEGKVILSLGYMDQPELHETQPQTKPNLGLGPDSAGKKECTQHKREDLSSNPQTHIQSQVVCYGCKPNTMEGRNRRTLRFAGHRIGGWAGGSLDLPDASLTPGS